MTLLFVALGAAVGAPLRYLTDRVIQARHDSVFPWGTLTVNVAGSFLVGVLATFPASESITALVGVGFCGAFTTYSSFSYETLRLAQDGARRRAVGYVVATMAAGLAAGACGLLLALAVTR